MRDLARVIDPTCHGSKAANLGSLIRAGLPVPAGVALAPGEAFRPRAWRGYGTLGSGAYAVRSSALGEDGAGAAYAGQHDSILDVPGEPSALLAAIRAVRRSARNPRALRYRLDRGLRGPAPMAVILQRMVSPCVGAAVVFTRDPVTGEDAALVEYAPGRGDALVGGRVTPVSVSVPAGAPFGDARIPAGRALLTLASRAAEVLRCPVDVEAVWDGRAWWLVQARPITTLAEPSTPTPASMGGEKGSRA